METLKEVHGQKGKEIWVESCSRAGCGNGRSLRGPAAHETICTCDTQGPRRWKQASKVARTTSLGESTSRAGLLPVYPVPCTPLSIPSALHPLVCSQCPIPPCLFPVPCTLLSVPSALHSLVCSQCPAPHCLFPVPCTPCSFPVPYCRPFLEDTWTTFLSNYTVKGQIIEKKSVGYPLCWTPEKVLFAPHALPETAVTNSSKSHESLHCPVSVL